MQLLVPGTMNRTGLVIALAVAVVAGLVFALYPELDIAISRRFYDPAKQDFPLRFDRQLDFPAPCEHVGHHGRWRRPPASRSRSSCCCRSGRMLMPGRAVLFLLATLALGPGLFVNVTMKEHWSRSRPIDIPEFNGDERFVPWWDPRGACAKNCSFVAGESSGAFWTLGAGRARSAPVARARLCGGTRIRRRGRRAADRMFGGHFFTDVVFAGIFIFLIVWIAHGVIYRWRRRLSDAGDRARDRADRDADLSRGERRHQAPRCGRAAKRAPGGRSPVGK